MAVEHNVSSVRLFGLTIFISGLFISFILAFFNFGLAEIISTAAVFFFIGVFAATELMKDEESEQK